MGRVGSTLAYTVLLKGLTEELVLADANEETAQGEALDLQHAEAFTAHPMKITAGGIDATAKSDIVVVCVSAPWKEEYTSRFDIGKDNARIFKKLIPAIADASPNAKLVIISNPLDVMTYYAIKLSGFGPKRVFGTGTLLDSARFRTLLSEEMGIHPDDLRAYILGEHGETQFPEFSTAVAGGTRIVENEKTHTIFEATCRAGWEVVNRKGHTNYAIAMAAALVIEAIAWDTRRTMPLSVAIDGFLGVRDVCLSLPVVIGRDGIRMVLEPELGPNEQEAFLNCASVVHNAIREILG